MNDAELEKYLKQMDLPEYRTNRFNKVNVEWLYKNLPKKNASHELFTLVYSEISSRVKNRIWGS